MASTTILTDRFDRALLYATHVHGGQARKGTSIPYIAHLLAVAATLLEYGGSEDMAIAGLLHDAVEDQGGEVLDTERPSTSSFAAVTRTDDVNAGMITVVVGLLGDAVAIGIERLPKVAESVPLRRALRIEQHCIVRRNVREAGGYVAE